jgi:hypothetical protein
LKESASLKAGAAKRQGVKEERRTGDGRIREANRWRSSNSETFNAAKTMISEEFRFFPA